MVAQFSATLERADSLSTEYSASDERICGATILLRRPVFVNCATASSKDLPDAASLLHSPSSDEY